MLLLGPGLALASACGGAASVAADVTSGTSGGETTALTAVDTTDESTTATSSPETSGAGSSSEGGSPTTTDTGSASSTVADSSSDGGTPVPGCPAGDLGNVVPAIADGNTLEQTDDFMGACGGIGPDAEYAFTAPADGTYTFDTHGSALNSVLYVLDGECSGDSLGCNDDGDGPQSVLEIDLVEGQQITIVVDGAAEVGGPFVLRAREGSFGCPEGDLGNMVPNVVAGDTTDHYRSHASSCGGGAGPDAGYVFTAPSAGNYTFDTFGSPFASILTVRDGACDGAEIACGYGGVLTDLDAGQTVVVFVDSSFAAGSFDLHVDSLSGACPDEDLGSVVPAFATSDTSSGDNTVAGSCGGFTQPDDLYLFTAGAAGLYIFDTFGSAYDTLLFVRDGGCDGLELGCNDDAGGGQQSQLALPLDAGQTVLVAVDGGTGSGDYELTIDRVMCPDEDLASNLPTSVGGATVGAFDKAAMVGCGAVDGNAPDYAFEWTAPAAAQYTFDLVGSDYDTVLYVQDAACGGNELGCNDDAVGLQSVVSVNLAQDQTVVLVISGWNGGAGNFVLNIN